MNSTSTSPKAANGKSIPTRLLMQILVPAPLPDLRILGRTVLHALLVGLAAGLVGAAFFAGLELAQRYLLELPAGYVALRAHGERFLAELPERPFRPWLLLLLPAAGALAGGWLTRRAPEARGGGGDAVIEAFHRHDGVIRPRVLWIKPLASVLTLGTGGAGGREGPTMQIGGALGSLAARLLDVSSRERRLLMVAGIAAGMSAVFRTPLGAALLAVELLYVDDFESEALVPAVLASVVSYSVVLAIFGESTLFARAPRYPFVAAHLPLYALEALGISVVATLFLSALRGVEKVSAVLPLPAWARPALGGLALGALAVGLLLTLGTSLGRGGGGLGILGGGYGIAQVAITGAGWLPGGWHGVEVLLLLCLAKLVGAALTIGSGGSAGDFAPSLVLGALFGGAFGRVAQMLLGDPRLDPGAFALVGMASFYGGVAHVPLASLILVCELAGNYDLLVPLMLAEAITFATLRHRALYRAQRPVRQLEPERIPGPELDLLRARTVGEVLEPGRGFASFEVNTRASEILARLPESADQDVFPVLKDGQLRGIITAQDLRYLACNHEVEAWVIADDVMQPPITVRATENLRVALERMLKAGLSEVPVLDARGAIIGLLDESAVTRAYLNATLGAQ